MSHNFLTEETRQHGECFPIKAHLLQKTAFVGGTDFVLFQIVDSTFHYTFQSSLITSASSLINTTGNAIGNSFHIHMIFA